MNTTYLNKQSISQSITQIFCPLEIFIFAVSLLFSTNSYANLETDLQNNSLWKSVINDNFNGNKLNDKIWQYETDLSGGGNRSLQAYIAQNITVSNGQLKIIAKPQWYVQKSATQGVARPYTSALIETKGKVSIDMSKPGRIDVRFQTPVGSGAWPAIWLYTTNSYYGGWSASGEIDIMEVWKKPDNSNPAFNNNPTAHIWFGGPYPHNAFLGATYNIPDPNSFHTVTFAWNARGSFIWQLDGVTTFRVTPTEQLYRSAPGQPLQPQTYGPGANYFSIIGDASIMNQPYQGTYADLYDGNGNPIIDPLTGLTKRISSPAPFDAHNPMYLIINCAVGGSPVFDDMYSGNIFDVGNSVDLSHVPDGVLSDTKATALGLPSRPSAFFTNQQEFVIDYVKYSTLKNKNDQGQDNNDQ